MANNLLRVEVAYAMSDKQCILPVTLERGSTIEVAIQRSGILAEFHEINLACQTVGVFSKARQLSDVVNDGDRIEIYRPLIIDPKGARLLKVKKLKSRSA